MFDFLFKRPPAQSELDNRPAAPESAAPPEAPRQSKEAALAQADALAGDEAGAVAFILSCGYSDARLKAAEHVHSRAGLEQVLRTIRNSDRRVAKLMQKRLDLLQQQAVWERQAQLCIEDALRLGQEAQLMPNQVAELDRAWSTIGAPPPQLCSAFEEARAVLRERLEAQASLQRAIIDVLARLRAAREACGNVAHEESVRQLDALEQEMARLRASRETASLPKALIPEFVLQHNSFRQTLAALALNQEAIAARHAALDQWEALPAAELKADALRRQWQALPKPDDAAIGAGLQARFEALLERTRAAPPAKPKPAQPEAAHDLKQRFVHELEELDKALQEGALQRAFEHDKALRALDFKAVRPSEAQMSELARARVELNRLQGWARWGGNVSREELFKAAEDMQQQSMAPQELAKKVGSLRERWKMLDGSAGPASKELWERFDAACSAAYAPAAAHFKKLADERHANHARAQALLEEVRRFITESNCGGDDAGAVDWKAVANFTIHTRQAWQRLGAIDRKEKKKLDTEFDAALQTVMAPLQRQREIEIRRREKLIEQAAELNPAERGALDNLRALQERWQEMAKALPLARKDEQDLWQRFRAACDAMFAKRKESAVAADAERQQQLQARAALCAQLEAAADQPEAAIVRLLREVRDAWAHCGPVPRAAEAQIEARYKAAIQGLQRKLDGAKRAAAAAEVLALRDKLRLCQALERSVAGGAPDERDWQQEWQVLPALSNEYERAMRQRFEAALAARQAGGAALAEQLQRNAAGLAEELLRLEILTGVESPPALARERLRLQVEVLQSSLKAGQKQASPAAQLLRVCSLPAAVDAAGEARIERLIRSTAEGAAPER